MSFSLRNFKLMPVVGFPCLGVKQSKCGNRLLLSPSIKPCSQLKELSKADTRELTTSAWFHLIMLAVLFGARVIRKSAAKLGGKNAGVYNDLGREKNGSIFEGLIKFSTRRVSCYCEAWEKQQRAAVKEEPGWGWGHAHLVLKLSVLLHPACPPCWAWPEVSGRVLTPVLSLLSQPPLPFLIDHSMQRPNPASFLSLPPPWLCLGLCVCWVPDICNSIGHQGCNAFSAYI